MSEKTNDSWIVEEMIAEVLDGFDGISATFRLSQNDSYQPTQQWPEPGQVLVIQSKEQDEPA